jgi:hypothetical protein
MQGAMMAGKASISLNVRPVFRFTEIVHCLRLEFLSGYIKCPPEWRTRQVESACHENVTSKGMKSRTSK